MSDEKPREPGRLTHGVVTIDLDHGNVMFSRNGVHATYELGSAEGFELVSRAWLRAGWDAKYVYSFTWAGRPVIQLPEDLVRIQEIVYAVRPRVIVETGIAHGGSLIFYAGLLKQMNGGRVVGIDIDIRPHNRKAIEAHELFEMITLVEGSSVDPALVEQVRSDVGDEGPVMVLLDSNHTRQHVLAELHTYAPLVTKGSYLVVADGIMRELVGAPRTSLDWDFDNPQSAVDQFLSENAEFFLDEPEFPFNEGFVRGRVTYWPRCYLRRRI